VVDAERDAICRDRRCIGWRWRWGSLARRGFEASLTTDGADSIFGRSEGATAGRSGGSCRVTANVSRLAACSAVGRGLTPALESLDDDHISPAAWARWTGTERLLRHVVIGRRGDGEEFAVAGKARLARRTCEQAIVADAV
jgi:hypothetical protein